MALIKPAASLLQCQIESQSDREALTKACVAHDWSKAIRILNSLLSQTSAASPSVQDICNRAFCYSKLDLHKHVIKDCDKALELDPANIQIYILKGRALDALGKGQDAFQVWKQGYVRAEGQSVDLRQLIELQELLASSKSDSPVIADDDLADAPKELSDSTTTSDSNCNTPLKIVEKSKPSQKENVAACPVKAVEKPKPSQKENVAACAIKPIEKTKPTQKENVPTLQASQKMRSISLDLRLSRGIAQVNDGNYDQAIVIFNQILRDNPNSPEALIGRGTAYAFQRNLEAAIADFSKAIQANPTTGEAWKRRGQARAALGETAEAVQDLTKALDFDPNSSDILHERGMVFFKAKEYEDAVLDLQACLKMDKDNKSAYSYMGLALVSIGEYKKAFEAHETAVHLDPNFKEGWYHMAQSHQDLSDFDKATGCLEKALSIDIRFVNAYRLRGLLKHGCGDHKGAIKELSAGLEVDKLNIECLYLRASSYHAIGEYGNAIKDYDAALNMDVDSHEKFVLQCLAFYQKELALYTASKANASFGWFDIDNDVHPLFKEAWCKRLHPKGVCEVVYRQPPLRESLKKGRIQQKDSIINKPKKVLIQAADHIGKKIQYNCPGFLKNRRQHRMAGMAAIEIAQKVSSTWKALREAWASGANGEMKAGKRSKKKEKGNAVSQNRGGACCSSTSTSDSSHSCSCHEDKSSLGRLALSWQEVYNIAVKWRQISEPCDPVVWVNKLGEEFTAGFGSHTPIVLGQAKVVRYYPKFQRAFSITKSLMLERKSVYNADNKVVDLSTPAKLKSIEGAQSCSDLYNSVGEDFWIVKPCNSTAFEGKILDGTRLTMQKKGAKSYDFAIRTPCTPPRWSEYHAEMAAAWEALCEACCREAHDSDNVTRLEKIQDCILRLSFYWYNFMPLARGTAAVGFVVLLGLLLAANMEFTGKIPERVQVDWEAILSADLQTFMRTVKPWLCSSLTKDSSLQSLPDVSATFATTGSVIAALSIYDV